MKTIKRATQAVVAILMILLAGQAYALETLHYVDKSAIDMSAKSGDDEWFTWDKWNTRLHIPLVATMYIDYRQTLNISESCDNLQIKKYGFLHSHESNIYLGACPSKAKVTRYYSLTTIGISALTYILPAKASYLLQGGTVTVELFSIGNNIYLQGGFHF